MLARSYEFHTTGETFSGHDQSSFLYPTSIENACWRSYIGLSPAAQISEDCDFLLIQERCEHIIIPYPNSDISVRMYVVQLNDTQVRLLFEHYTDSTSKPLLCARTQKTIGCVRRFQTRCLPAEWPEPIRRRLDELGVTERGISETGRLRLFHRIRSFLSSVSGH